MPYYARSANATGQKQLLKDHLQQVGELAESFATEAGLPPDMGRWAGLLHDLGKYSDEFQRYRLGVLPDGSETSQRWQVEHAGHGASVAAEAGAIEIAFSIAAHHSGLRTFQDVKDLRTRDEKCPIDVGKLADRARRFAEIAKQQGVFAGAPPATVAKKGEELTLDLRTCMLLSCLADADRLNAQDWATPEDTANRTVSPALRGGRFPRRQTTGCVSSFCVSYIISISDSNRLSRGAIIEP